MKITYLSDLHLEFGPLAIDPEPTDLLILAGDITVKNKVYWINEMADRFPHVIYVLGNHEFYRSSLDSTIRHTGDNLDSRIHFLNNESVTIDGITFHGATLWTDMMRGDPFAYILANQSMNDFRLIRADNGQSRFTAQRSHTEHNISKSFLSDNIKEGDVVITHHAPSFKSTHPDYAGDKLNSAYMSDLSDLMLDKKPKLWFHGHVHNSFDYKIGDTRILCNPRGYVKHGLNPTFNVNATVEI